MPYPPKSKQFLVVEAFLRWSSCCGDQGNRHRLHLLDLPRRYQEHSHRLPKLNKSKRTFLELPWSFHGLETTHKDNSSDKQEDR